MNNITEDTLEYTMIDRLKEFGYGYLHGFVIAPDGELPERDSYDQVVLKDRLRSAIDKLNPELSEEAKEQAFKQIINLPSQNLIENNEALHVMMTEGVEVEILGDDGVIGKRVKFIDYENVNNNDYLAVNQFTIIKENVNKRPDVILFVNGLPLVVIELKNPTDENATLKKAFTQLQNYKNAIPDLFFYNSILIASDGFDAKTGSLTAGWTRFMNWKSVDGIREDKLTIPQLDTLTRGMLRPDVLLDLIRYFTVFEKASNENKETGSVTVETIKKIAAYHQYYAVNKAVESTVRASAHSELILRDSAESYGLPSVDNQPKGDHKAGVFWHTQGSGKSLSMVFYSGKIVQQLKNPTIVVVTDRNDLDDQLFETFANCKQLLRQKPVQAEDKEDLKRLLKTTGGGIIFSTIQKFAPTNNSNVYEMLSNRENIIVIADEAHRSHYGFNARHVEINAGVEVRYGNAKYIRDAIPNASFIGFTGTPIEQEDKSTPAIFGNYIDVYDIQQAVEDGSTVKIYYESRLAKVHLKEDQKELLDEAIEEITESEETTASERAKAKWTSLEAIVGNRERLKTVAKDIVDHYEKRQEVFEGKAMIVTMSRRIAVELYEEIVKIKPEWHSEDLSSGVIKVVMTSTSSDPENWQIHNTNKQDRKALATRMKDSSDTLKLVIVRDMWLTGFDAPSTHTMYVDKPMRGHNLMQAIARVNRVFKDKPGGLIVDYIGIASDLKEAMSNYTESGGKGAPIFDQSEAVALMLEKLEIVEQMFDNFDYEKYFIADTHKKLTLILEAQEYILSLEDGKDRFTKQVEALSKAFALSVPDDKALEIKDKVGFFQAIKTRLRKFTPTDGTRSDEDIETAIRQIIDEAVVVDGVVDIFDSAGIKKPDISILSEEFLLEVKAMERKNLAFELLKKLLNDEIKIRNKKNHIQSKKLSEMLENAIKKYQNNLLTAAEVIDELIKIAQEIKNADKRGDELGLEDYEVAFYDALANNGSALEVLGKDKLKELAVILVERVKSSTSIDWTIRESAKANIRVIVKRTLRKYGYPPDQEKLATENVLEQAKLLADEWAVNK